MLDVSVLKESRDLTDFKWRSAGGRALAAIMKNYQNTDGSITVPDVLIERMGGLRVIEVDN